MEERDEEQTHEVKDKRRVNPDGSLREETQAEEIRTEEQTDQVKPDEQEPSHEQGEPEEMPPPDVYAMLGFMFNLMTQQAWQLMGIHLVPGQKEPFKDMAQAKVAIDTASFIADKLEPRLSEDERKALRAAISDLQMNFVSHS